MDQADHDAKLVNKLAELNQDLLYKSGNAPEAVLLEGQKAALEQQRI